MRFLVLTIWGVILIAILILFKDKLRFWEKEIKNEIIFGIICFLGGNFLVLPWFFLPQGTVKELFEIIVVIGFTGIILGIISFLGGLIKKIWQIFKHIKQKNKKR